MFGLFIFSIPMVSIIVRRLLFIWNSKKQIKQIKSTKEKTEDYFLKNLTEFKKIVKKREQTKPNENIDTVFYNKKKWNDLMVEDNNVIEKKWKQRILYEATPLGNIIMKYDAYKMGFSYNADVFIPYNILNAVALKYVRIFKCVDFFMDEKIMEEDDELREQKSQLMKLYHSHEDEEPKEPKFKKQKISKKEEKILQEYKIKKETEKSVFMKKKITQMTKEEIEKQKLIEKEQKYTSNHFYNLGKTANFNLLIVPPKKEKAIKKISYKDYKQYKFTDNPVFSNDNTVPENSFTPSKNSFSI
jgi:hypothetical protein